ncbi:DUF1513 domain-containing protein [Oceanobacter mangrovi]|uniref:DUF1513 domain-containing protein n=1 Tax=Oceanobacter mangrovi TaxID=2862510 RepID=UPI001C8EA0CC|nr:DUF1513 domain-containing protein [Oceanobacter mangrovi]
MMPNLDIRANRRQFCKQLAGAAAAMGLPGLALNGCSVNASDRILGGGKYLDANTGQLRYVLSVVDLATQKSQQLAMSFLPHGIDWHPQMPDRLVVFEKKGPHACEVDLNAMAISRQIATVPERHFYGHGVYAADNSVIYNTETWLDQRDGVIAVRDAATLEYLGEFPSYGKEPHECKLIQGGAVLAITNAGGGLGGEQPSVTFVDVKTRRLLERIELTNDKLNTGHLEIEEDGSLVVLSAPRIGLEQGGLGGVSLMPDGEAMQSVQQPLDVVGRMFGEALSLVTHQPTGVTLVTHPDGNMITLWDLHQRRLLNAYPLETPRGVTLSADQAVFIVSFGRNPAFLKIPTQVAARDRLLGQTAGEWQRGAVVPGTWISGSHLFNWSAPHRELGFPLPHLPV